MLLPKYAVHLFFVHAAIVIAAILYLAGQLYRFFNGHNNLIGLSLLITAASFFLLAAVVLTFYTYSTFKATKPRTILEKTLVAMTLCFIIAAIFYFCGTIVMFVFAKEEIRELSPRILIIIANLFTFFAVTCLLINDITMVSKIASGEKTTIELYRVLWSVVGTVMLLMGSVLFLTGTAIALLQFWIFVAVGLIITVVGLLWIMLGGITRILGRVV